MTPLIKNGAGKVAIFSFASINKVLGRSIIKCLEKKPTSTLIDSRNKKSEYISNLKLESLTVKFLLGKGVFGNVVCVED